MHIRSRHDSEMLDSLRTEEEEEVVAVDLEVTDRGDGGASCGVGDTARGVVVVVVVADGVLRNASSLLLVEGLFRRSDADACNVLDK